MSWEVSVHSGLFLLCLGHGEAEHTGGKHGRSKADHIIVGGEGEGHEPVEGKRDPGQAAPFLSGRESSNHLATTPQDPTSEWHIFHVYITAGYFKP